MLKSEDGFLSDYNSHDWSRFEVRDPESKPTSSHYAAVLFERRLEYSPPYDSDDHSRSYEVPEIRYFAFPDKKTLEAWILRAVKSNKNFFFFEVKSLGAAKLNVSVDT